jgi:hypothetical protein
MASDRGSKLNAFELLFRATRGNMFLRSDDEVGTVHDC